MKPSIKSIVVAVSLIALSSFTLAARADAKNMPAIQDYTYSTKLDIAKVRHISSLDFCGVQPVVMNYTDHTGAVHNLRYETEGNKCLSDN